MVATGLWFDTEYSACVFALAKAMSQRLRQTIPWGIASWGQDVLCSPGDTQAPSTEDGWQALAGL